MKNLMFVVAHKDCELVQDSFYQPIIVGTNQVNIVNAWRDNIKNNIAHKNPFYCELTAQYWVWKNKAEEYDSVGLCHYRRYFTKNIFSNNKSMLLTSSDIDKCFKSYDAILAKPFRWDKSVAEIYYVVGSGKKKDLDLTCEAIQNLYPDYIETYNQVLCSKQASYCNMVVLRKRDFDAYCQWLFSILEYVESRIDMTGYSVQEKRVFGFLSEILLNVWIVHNQLRVKYFPIAYMEMSSLQQIKYVLRTYYHNMKRGLRDWAPRKSR